MRTYRCTCGNVTFFDNTHCLACGKELGFCPVCRELATLEPGQNGQYVCGNSGCGTVLEKCLNYATHQVCNRCVIATEEPGEHLCDCCRFNEVIPDLSVEGNLQRWYKLEAAKRRLFYDLSELGLPYGNKDDGIEPELRFDFKGDVIGGNDRWHSVGKAEKVYTSHNNGLITINIQEADEAEREKLRVDMQEAHRTLIGHFRHETGHYYWDMLVKGKREEECIATFRDHNNPTYDAALKTYYENGPPANWRDNFVSAYATMHPWEDFAETWAAYLDMVSTLDTAENNGFGGQRESPFADLDSMVQRYQELGIALNELNRNQGLLDLVPEVFVPAVITKMRFIHRLVRQGHAENGILIAESPPPVEIPAIPAENPAVVGQV
ncbi:MAG: putative zinc-binding metallopeptidase [Planctomycetales bacterium]